MYEQLMETVVAGENQALALAAVRRNQGAAGIDRMTTAQLAFYVEWQMRKDLAPLLFDDEQLDQDRKRRDPVLPAECSASAKAKKWDRVTADGFPVHSFNTLLSELATRCRNICRIPSAPHNTAFQQVTEATPLQARALQLLGL